MTQWLPVVGCERQYEVSDDGQVRRIAGRYSPNGRILKPVIRNEYLCVNLSVDNKRVQSRIHRLMAEAFLPNPEGLPYVRHLNDVKTDIRLVNLAWGTSKQNKADSFRNGYRASGYPVRPFCKHGHEFTPENTIARPAGDGRGCRACRNERAVRYRAKRLAQTP